VHEPLHEPLQYIRRGNGPAVIKFPSQSTAIWASGINATGRYAATQGAQEAELRNRQKFFVFSPVNILSV
jgi:hypothetical protein